LPDPLVASNVAAADLVALHCRSKDELQTIIQVADMTTKAAVIELIRQLPDDVGIDEIMDELYARRTIEQGLRQLDAGETLPHEEVQRRLARWLA
jgi:predicted transcriptional regulator